MVYSVEKLLTVEECDNMVQIANEEKNELTFKKGNLEHRISSYEGRSVKFETDLAAASAELTSLEGIFATLPVGEVKNDVQSRIKKLEYKKWLLEERSSTYGSIALLEQEIEIAKVDAIITELDAFIAAVNTHRATL